MKNNYLFYKAFHLFRRILIILPIIMLTQCFQIAHVLDWKEDGSLQVNWIFRFSKALDQAQNQGGGSGSSGDNLSSMMEKEKKELPESLKGLVKNMSFKKIETEYDSGMDISFIIPDYTKFPFDKIKKEDFPMIPKYLPDKKQIIFHFQPVKKLEDQKKDEKGKVEEKKESSADKAPVGDKSMDQMSKQISQLFLSSVRYQIFLGKKFNVDKIEIKKGSSVKKIEGQKISDLILIDIPLFAILGEKDEPFDLVVQLK